MIFNIFINLLLMTSLLPVFCPSYEAFADDAPIPLSLAYPAEGTILNAQIGLIFERTDILRSHGFKSTVTAMGTGRELKTALVSAKADVILTTESNFIVLLGSGYPAFAINSLGSAGRMALVVKDSSRIKSIADLKGKKIGTIFGTSIHQPAMQWAMQSESRVLDIGSLAAMESALATGTLDATMTWDPFLEAALQSHRERILKSDEFYLIALASKAFKDHPGAVSKLNEAIKEAVAYYSFHRREVNTWFSERTHLDLLAIDNATKINLNYNIAQAQDVKLGFSDALLQRLKIEGEFFSKKHLLALPNIDIASHIIRP